DPITGKLGMIGLLNDKGIGNPALTATPPAVYVLEPNILTKGERDELLNLSSELAWTTAVLKLFDLSRNPNCLQPGSATQDPYSIGIEAEIKRNADGSAKTNLSEEPDAAKRKLIQTVTVLRDPAKGAPQQTIGPGLALVANADFLDPSRSFPNIS